MGLALTGASGGEEGESLEGSKRVGDAKQEGMTNSSVFSLLTVPNESLFRERLRASSVWEMNSTCSKGPFVKEMPKKCMVLSQAMQVLNEECQYMVFRLQH